MINGAKQFIRYFRTSLIIKFRGHGFHDVIFLDHFFLCDFLPKCTVLNCETYWSNKYMKIVKVGLTSAGNRTPYSTLLGKKQDRQSSYFLQHQSASNEDIIPLVTWKKCAVSVS